VTSTLRIGSSPGVVDLQVTACCPVQLLAARLSLVMFETDATSVARDVSRTHGSSRVGPPISDGAHLRLFHPVIHDEAIVRVTDALRSGWIGCGPRTTEFEQALATMVVAPYCVALNSRAGWRRTAKLLYCIPTPRDSPSRSKP
jgi:hypothetical protein